MSVRPSGGATDEDSGDQTGDVTGESTAEQVGAAGGEPGGRTLPRMIASAPWVMVLVGVAVLAVLLVVALLSFRGPERPVAWAPGPPMVLPTAAGESAGSGLAENPTASPAGSAGSATPSGSASPNVSSTQPVDPSRTGSTPPRSGATRSPSPAAPAPPPEPTGTVTASYRVQDSGDTESFEAQLTVRNGTGRSSDWQVELRFNGGVTGIRASSGPGVSVTIKGTGWYLLSGTGQLDAGVQQSVQLRFTRTGGGEYPAQCTVNGTACGIG